MLQMTAARPGSRNALVPIAIARQTIYSLYTIRGGTETSRGNPGRTVRVSLEAGWKMKIFRLTRLPIKYIHYMQLKYLWPCIRSDVRVCVQLGLKIRYSEIKREPLHDVYCL